MTNKKLIVSISGDIDWGELETIDSMEKYINVLQRYNVTATLFVTAKVVEDYPDRIDYLLKGNQEIAGHGDVHEPFYGSVNKQHKRLKNMIEVFKDVLDIEITGFRAPWYKHNENTYLALDKAGLLYDSSKKRFEIAFKKVPYVERKYLDFRYYKQIKPILRGAAQVYNYFSHTSKYPYFITKNVLEIPALGISDTSLIHSVKGPRYQPEDYKKIANIWLENLECLTEGGILVINAHPGSVSPEYMPAIEYFIKKSQEKGAEFKNLGCIAQDILNNGMEG